MRPIRLPRQLLQHSHYTESCAFTYRCRGLWHGRHVQTPRMQHCDTGIALYEG